VKPNQQDPSTGNLVRVENYAAYPYGEWEVELAEAITGENSYVIGIRRPILVNVRRRYEDPKPKSEFIPVEDMKLILPALPVSRLNQICMVPETDDLHRDLLKQARMWPEEGRDDEPAIFRERIETGSALI
jgi:hypothetical protein